MPQRQDAGPMPARGKSPTTLDPADWPATRASAHQMLDDILDHLQTRADQPLWQPAPGPAKAAFHAPVPRAPTPLDAVHASFVANVLPYGSGNTHPGFMGWVQGGGTVAGMLAEMLAGGFNANVGGRDHMAITAERQITAWMREIFDFPAEAGGLFLTGASQANFVAVLIARARALGQGVRQNGIGAARLTAYTSAAAHGCIPRAMEMAGIGSDALRAIATTADGQIDTAALTAAIAADRAAGMVPFLIVGTAGTVNIGAVDDLDALADIARTHGLHFHVDGAIGALCLLSDRLAPRFHGIKRADSIAFDFHKWAQVPYDAGFLLTRDGPAQRQCFASENAYLTRAETGLAGGDWWPCDYGPDLSRGFRALKTWFTFKTYGLDAIAAMMDQSCALAQTLAARIAAEPRLELMAPVALNIVCFRYRDDAPADTLNARIVEALHAEGRVAPSLTFIGPRRAIRAALFNHRTTIDDIDALVASTLRLGAVQE
jgi:aromatic-L-amino-acid/L-tryptophan decarboxylase